MFGFRFYAILIAAGLALAAVSGAWLYVGHLRHEAAVARSERDAALAQASLNASAGQIVERTVTRETHITTRSEADAHAVLEAPGATAPLDSAMLDAWRRGVLAQRGGADPGGDGAAQ